MSNETPYLVMLPGLCGPEPQIWYGRPMADPTKGGTDFVGCAGMKPIDDKMTALPRGRWTIEGALEFAYCGKAGKL